MLNLGMGKVAASFTGIAPMGRFVSPDQAVIDPAACNNGTLPDNELCLEQGPSLFQINTGFCRLCK